MVSDYGQQTDWNLVAAIDQALGAIESARRSEVRDLILDDLEVANENQGGIGSHYLERVTVSGFRGVGKALDVPLVAQPGLTVFTARNGTGKSSIVEAAEVLLCGHLRRVSAKNGDLAQGLEHLGESRDTHLAARLVTSSGDVDLVFEGSTAPMVIPRDEISVSGVSAYARDRLFQMLERLHPVLGSVDFQVAASESGAQVSQYLADVIGDGLECLVSKYGELKRDLGQIPKDEPRDLLRLFGEEVSDDLGLVGLVEALRENPTSEQVRRWCRDNPAQTPVPAIAHTLWARAEPEQIEEAVRTMQQSATEFEAADQQILVSAEALDRVIQDLLDSEAAVNCPVCATTLGPNWRSTLSEANQRLSNIRSELSRSRGEYSAARSKLERLLPQPTAEPALSPTQEASAKILRQMREALLGAADVRDYSPTEVNADDFIELSNSLLEELTSSASDAANIALNRAQRVDSLCVSLDEAWANADRRILVGDACGVIETVYSERLQSLLEAPGGQVVDVFNELCARTGVSLRSLAHNGQIPAKGKKPRLELEIDVRGSEGTRGMLSLGQVSALALGFFLQRFAADDNPIRFMLLDDPVLALDEVRIDSLVELLNRYATEFDLQVIVFTHDLRIERAARSICAAANLHRLGYRNGELSITKSEAPAERLLRHANKALEQGNDSFRRRVIPALVRQAIEATALPLFLRNSGWDSSKWDKAATLKRRLDGAGLRLVGDDLVIVDACDEGAHTGLSADWTPATFLAEGEALVERLASAGTILAQTEGAADA